MLCGGGLIAVTYAYLNENLNITCVTEHFFLNDE